MKIADIEAALHAQGANPAHIARIFRAWTQGKALDAGARRQAAADTLPKRVREFLPGLSGQLDHIAEIQSEHPGQDGSARWLVKLADGQAVESVLLPRDGVCISTQIGCAVGCTFCMTGRDGLIRQVGSAEMVAQVVLARRRRPVRRVVFMGMGEPAHNLDNVLEAIALLGTEGAIGHKNLVFSTVGDLRVFERLPKHRVVPALAISLHSTDPELRARLLPNAPRISPQELVDRAEIYARQTGYPIQYQWTLLEGINDRLEDMAQIAHLLRGKYALMNLIPYNTTAALDYRRPSLEHITKLARHLHGLGIRTTVRNSAGQDVDGGCGQLRARAEAPLRRHTPAARHNAAQAAAD